MIMPQGVHNNNIQSFDNINNNAHQIYIALVAILATKALNERINNHLMYIRLPNITTEQFYTNDSTMNSD